MRANIRTRTRGVFTIAVSSAVLSVFLGVLAQSGFAAERVPMLMDGKTSLYQKVLTRPGAVLHAEPNGAEKGDLTPFSVHFVYDRQSVGEERWIEIGVDRQGDIVGWVPESRSIDWKHSLTASFTNTAGRQRMLLMRSQESLEVLVNSPDLLVEVESARASIDSGRPPKNTDIISVEPEKFVDFRNQFYLLPILEVVEVYPDSIDPLTLLKVASVSAAKDPEELAQDPKSEPPAEFSASMTFVIDATSSMQPYIDVVREAVRQVHTRIEKAGIEGQLSYGLVAFRDSVEAVPGLEFVAKTYADPNTTKTAEEFLTKIETLKAASVSSKGFSEDAYAGLSHALNDIDWSSFASKQIILVTDASAREGYDPLSTSRLVSEDMTQSLLENNFFTTVMHLRTDVGKDDHQKAERQYRAVSRFNDGSGRELYVAIDAGDPASFEKAVNRVSNDIIGQLTKSLGDYVEEVKRSEKNLFEAKTDEEKERRRQELNAALVGLAIKLEYFGERENTTVPQVFEAWIADKDFRDQTVPTLQIRLLLSKNQMSDLREAMKRILEVAERGTISTDDFFAQLQAAAAAMGRSPDRINQAGTLEELGLIGEYLDGLPYRSQAMAISQEIWVQFTVSQQVSFVDKIRSKLELLEKFHDNTDNWVLLSGRSDAGEAFYPVPLSALP